VPLVTPADGPADASWPPFDPLSPIPSRNTVTDARSFLADLIGRPLRTVGFDRPNRILRLEGDQVIVVTSRLAKGQPVPMAWDLPASKPPRSRGPPHYVASAWAHRLRGGLGSPQRVRASGLAR
jgi:hypothetical protein